MTTPMEDFQIEFLILADKAEVLGGKLYMMGGGYDRKYIGNIEGPVDLVVVAGILVPWHSTNRELAFSLSIEDVDGKPLLEKPIEGTLRLGRPADAEEGQTFRVMSVLNGRLKLPGYGTYRVVATAGGSSRGTTFYALPSKNAAPQN